MENLELHVFTVDQNAHNFRVSGKRNIERLFERIRPDVVFGKPLLSLQSETCTSVIRADDITRIDVVTDLPSPWPLHFGLQEAEQLTELRFAEELGRAFNRKNDGNPNDLEVRLVELALVNRRRIYLRLVAASSVWNKNGAEAMLQKMLEAPSYHFHRHGGGIVILNSRNVIHADFHPGLPQVPDACYAEPTLGGLGSLVAAYAAVET
jgi:hypothetical protein